MTNSSSSWESFIFSSTVSVFTKEGNLDRAFFDIGQLSLWGLTIPDDEDKICNEYDYYIIPLYEYLFSFLGVCLSFTTFEVGVLNYLMVAPSQLHPTSWQPLREEFYTLARSTKRDFVALSRAGSDYWEALWSERVREEKVWLERSVTSLAFERDAYLRELQKSHASLKEVHKAFAPFKLLDTVGNQAVHLSRELEERTWALESAQGELEFLC
ncbi:hypothetical protein KIW84_057245 [Lathyrus oleraceus]|uniref:Uncharacterized protein n=1 Tax=Pisum sativum TaxID=3888 RepID=A0A9D4X0H0_PEA|nr:hypothetical protein KIW84_057245 [Pisum sativum]